MDTEPLEMAWTDTGNARFVWPDGHESIYTPAQLRELCPCAECRGTHGGPPKAFKAFKVLSEKQVKGAAVQTVINNVDPVGNYGICFTWGDGHKDGIYTWSMLRQNSPQAKKHGGASE